MATERLTKADLERMQAERINNTQYTNYFMKHFREDPILRAERVRDRETMGEHMDAYPVLETLTAEEREKQESALKWLSEAKSKPIGGNRRKSKKPVKRKSSSKSRRGRRRQK